VEVVALESERRINAYLPYILKKVNPLMSKQKYDFVLDLEPFYGNTFDTRY